MDFNILQSHLDSMPFIVGISSEQGKILYDFILKKKPLECLELGFAHGKSSCYIAAALAKLGRGHLTSVDLTPAMQWQKPSIEELLSKTGLQNYVTVEREMTSYNWFLKKKIEAQSTSGFCNPIYDFCFIDGSKNWTIDSCAFFLVDKLLKERGWIIFDDYKWTYAAANKIRTQTDGINHLELGEDELETPHIELIFRLLVMQNPDYSEFIIQDDTWAYAHKVKQSSKVVKLDTQLTLKKKLIETLKSFKKK